MNELYRQRRYSFARFFLDKPDEGGGGGKGKTLEEKLSAAQGELKAAQDKVTSMTSELDTAKNDLNTSQAEVATLQGQFESATTEVTNAKADVSRLTGELATVNGRLATTEGELGKAKANVSRLEKLCGVKGVDPNQAVPPVPEGDGADMLSQAEWAAKINGEKDPKRKAALLSEFEKAATEGRVAKA